MKKDSQNQKKASEISPSLLSHCRLGLNCKSPSKGYLTIINYRLFSKVKINSVIIFALATVLHKLLHQVQFTSFTVDYVTNSITEMCKTTCCREIVNILIFSHLTSKRVQSRKDSAVCHYLLNCNYSPTFDLRVLCHENTKYLLELKENLLIIRGRPSMNWNMRSASLYPLEWVLVTLFAALCKLQCSGF